MARDGEQHIAKRAAVTSLLFDLLANLLNFLSQFFDLST